MRPMRAHAQGIHQMALTEIMKYSVMSLNSSLFYDLLNEELLVLELTDDSCVFLLMYPK